MASTSSETPSLSSSSSSSSSSSIFRPKYDVFLSFRGEDTRYGFTDHLYEEFMSKGIEAFRDSEKLQLGQEIAPELIQAIEKSQYAIVVFSKKYANSRWCLDELAEIVECKKNKGLKVVPVFYHVDPSDIRNQTGPFEKAFDEHQRNDRINREKIQKWKDAMREVGNLSGEHLLPHQRSEAKCIKVIVKEIINKLSNTFSADTVGLIGMKTRVEKLKSHLAMESNDVRIIGIWGTGGMGKTTLARVVYRMISNKFEACSFIANIREESKTCLHKIQQILLRELLNDRDLKVHNVHNGALMIKSRLRNKKILLVLDDVSELDQLKNLVGENCWFGLGSRVMITTRDKHLLVSREVKEIYEAEGLNDEEALQLFSSKALKMDHPPEDYEKLSQAFVNYSKGLPLALEVLGSFLFRKNINEWKNGLDRLNEFPDRRILDVLQISFDGLQSTTEKDIFLNIACFFNHMYLDFVIKRLDYLGLYPEIGLRVLIDKSLVKLHENQLWMHHLLQEMGRDIVHQECHKYPGKRSRLWLFEDIDNVLTKNTGTKAIQGIVLKLHEPKKVYWNPEAFSKMQDLKLLEICGVQLMHDLKHLPKSLRILDWRGYPSKSLTSSFQSKSFENLKFMNLSNSLKLIEAPDIIEVPNLESLVLKNCINLRRIHPSNGIHKKLSLLTLARCKNLTILPKCFEMECLTLLDLYGCSKITKIPEFGRNMKRLRSLLLTSTAITKLPMSIEHLTALDWIDLDDCKNLVHLPNAIFNLKLVKRVTVEGCSKLDRLPENLGNAESLEELVLNETAIRKVPSSIGLLKHLNSLEFRGCKGLSMPTSPHPKDLLFSSLSLSPASSLSWLDLKDCKLKAVSNDIGSLFNLYSLDLSGNDFVCLPESIIRLSKLEQMFLNNCTSLRSLPKLPLNVRRVKAEGCISLEMLPDPLKPSGSLEPSLYLQNCSQLADNQSWRDRFISGIKKYLKLSPSLPLSFQENRYETLIPGNKIPEWFSCQSMGNEVKIKQPSHLCKKVGLAICLVFCMHGIDPYNTFCSRYWLIANGKGIYIGECYKVSSDHLWLVYVTPQFFNEESNKLLWEGDVNGFSQIRIKIETFDSRVKVKKWGLRMIYKKDIEDLDRTMVQYSNSSITLYGNSDSEESSEYKDCDEELSDRDESNDDWEEDNDDSDKCSVDRGKYSESDLDD